MAIAAPISSNYTVKSTSPFKQYKKVNLIDQNGKTIQIKVHRFAQIAIGDNLYVDPSNSNRVFIVSAEDSKDKIQVIPHFERTESIAFGSMTFRLLIKEIITSEELADYELLEGYHYKTSTAILSEETENGKGKEHVTVGGRKSVLMCYLRMGNSWQPIGYIELQMPLLMVKPRHILFNNPFHHPFRPINWDLWNQDSLKKYVNLIVRIARVVVSPDFRGIGLARFLVQKAKQFAIERWQINGHRPLFIEISAEMLKYLDFVSKAGLVKIGATQGNLSRINQDLVYMQKNYAITSGIMTLQKKYLNSLKDLSTELKKDFNEVLAQLKSLTEGIDEATLRTRLNDLTPEEWYMFRKVLRFPIPYYLGGLDEYSQKYIESHVESHYTQKPQNINIKHARIYLKDITINQKYFIQDSSHVRAIRNCFGIESNIINSRLVGPISIEASPGNIIMITGSNGTGKSLLLKTLDPNFNDTGLVISRENKIENEYKVAWLKQISSDKPIIEYFSEKWGIEASILALNQAGLSEAFIYLKPYKLLSRGQQYRAQLAELSFGKEAVWLVDEFCTDLDPLAAKIVANNFRKHVIKNGRIAFIAAANHAHYLDELRPTQIIILSYNMSIRKMSYKEYRDEFYLSTE